MVLMVTFILFVAADVSVRNTLSRQSLSNIRVLNGLQKGVDATLLVVAWLKNDKGTIWHTLNN